MRRLTGAACGILAAGFGVAVAELLAAATRPAAGPLVAVGTAVIDATPTTVKEFVIRQLGTNDKPVLIATIIVGLALFAAAMGMLSQKHRAAAIIGSSVFGVAGAAAAVTGAAARWYDAAPSLVGAAVCAVTLLVLVRRAGAAGTGPPPDLIMVDGRDDRPFDRRAFLRAAGLVAGGAVVAGGSAALVGRARGGAIARSREAITLPAAADPAKPVPAGVAPGFRTPNDRFYRVDTALTVPDIDPAGWSLRVHGMVDQELTLSFQDLLDRPLIERTITLNCVSNEVGGPYVGTATWLGVPLAPLLREIGVDARADQVVARSSEGMTIGTPVQTVLDGRDAMLCVGMNGEPLPQIHGFPVRMLTPGLYGYAGSCKWISELELTTFADFDPYWVRRGWSARAPVKTASRIDRPRPFAQLKTGRETISGVAWAQGRGIEAVEVRVDDGPWEKAELLPVPSVNTWVQWRLPWSAKAGQHSIAVRAVDGDGQTQTEKRATPFPDGATGWHTITVTVG
ncbi:molybdopterin-dependent oxidoreductase [Mangrovihabitans endophyticus]|uniref:Oxidoreductase n=1 Tax=Mangrovihabitans endophyticus TaxID=1751298 RepID=A0A8J3C4Q4_9ACTN|nr:molybdopterin-dependent oxidoreductase [Mangrovihabitans endophyticus]GGL18332.1 oxidoreductase [Mangrovihabitans endophyticus]